MQFEDRKGWAENLLSELNHDVMAFSAHVVEFSLLQFGQ
jgi:hypothetical protein